MMKLATTLTLSGLWLAMLAALGQQPAPPRASKPAAPITIQTIERSIARIGSRATLDKYFCAFDASPEGFDLITTGSKEWVAMAVRMLPYSDAGCSESLHACLGEAMQKQPRNVLPYVGKSASLSAENICLPFVSAEIPDAEALRIVRRSKAALSSVKDKALKKQCQACLTETNDLEKKILSDMAKAAAKRKKK